MPFNALASRPEASFDPLLLTQYQIRSNETIPANCCVASSFGEQECRVQLGPLMALSAHLHLLTVPLLHHMPCCVSGHPEPAVSRLFHREDHALHSRLTVLIGIRLFDEDGASGEAGLPILDCRF